MRWDKVFRWYDRLFQYPGGFLARHLPCPLCFVAEKKWWTTLRPPPLLALIACSSLLLYLIHISLLPLPLLLRLIALHNMTPPMPPGSCCYHFIVEYFYKHCNCFAVVADASHFAIQCATSWMLFLSPCRLSGTVVLAWERSALSDNIVYSLVISTCE